MATLQKIRNRAGLLIIVIGLALLAFIVGGALNSGPSLIAQSKQVALKVDGKKIGIQEYQDKLQQLTQAYEAQGRQLTDADRMNINNQLAQEFIQNRAIEKIAKAVGLEVTGKEYVALLTGNGVTQNFAVRQFLQSYGINPDDKTAINEFIKSMDESRIAAFPEEQQRFYRNLSSEWDNVTSRLINERIVQKYSAIMSRSYAINKIDANFVAPGVVRTVAMVSTPSTILQDSTTIATDQEVKAFYEAHPADFKLSEPYTTADYIAVQVRPSAKDYKAKEEEMNKLRQALIASNSAADIVRNLNDAFAPDFYLSEKDVEQLPLSPALIEFIKTAGAGEVNTPALEMDSYSLVKIIDRTTGTTGLSAQAIFLDSINAPKIDSLVAAINNGSDMAAIAKEYTIDPRGKENSGYFTFRNQQGMMDSTLTEAMAVQSGLDTLFHMPVKKAIAMTLPNSSQRYILRVDEIKSTGNKYKIAYGKLPMEFSEETYKATFSKINSILASDKKSFDAMKEEAKNAGFEIREDVPVMSSSATLGAIPSSREVVSWILRGKKGEINDKLFRCGNDYLVIAKIGDKVEGKVIPLAKVEDQIRDRLTMEKRGDKLAEKLSGQHLSSLEAYATAMQSTIDTVPNVSANMTGNMPAMFSAKALSTPLGTLSQPFRADTQVIVVKPLSENKTANAGNKSELDQRRRGIGQAISYRSFGHIISEMNIEDNRGRFY